MHQKATFTIKYKFESILFNITCVDLCSSGRNKWINRRQFRNQQKKDVSDWVYWSFKHVLMINIEPKFWAAN